LAGYFYVNYQMVNVLRRGRFDGQKPQPEAAKKRGIPVHRQTGYRDTTTNRGSQAGNLISSSSKPAPRKKAGHLFRCEAFSFTFSLIS
jgi:hypothetical protein